MLLVSGQLYVPDAGAGINGLRRNRSDCSLGACRRFREVSDPSGFGPASVIMWVKKQLKVRREVPMVGLGCRLK